MATSLIKSLYTARATATGGRAGHAVSDDGLLDMDLRPPKEMGGPSGATNPEQLFAAGYAACFQSALGVVGRRDHVDTSNSLVEADVSIGPVDGGGYGLAVALGSPSAPARPRLALWPRPRIRSAPIRTPPAATSRSRSRSPDLGSGVARSSPTCSALARPGRPTVPRSRAGYRVLPGRDSAMLPAAGC